jgi:septal ring factor EnvC (AmiA/AmiB activator)
MEYVLPKHVAEFMKEKNEFQTEIKKLTAENEILRHNVRECERQLRDARIRIKDLTSYMV